MPVSAVALAYFTVVEDQRTGWTGGLLLLSSGGRPLEFQCTLPVRPSRAHEILFGVSLREHLIGEVIGPLLVKKCRTPISMLCCDQPESMAMDGVTDFPIALVVDAAEEEEGPISSDTLTGCGDVMLAGTQLLVPMEQVEQAALVADQMKDLADASEPFERIREAIKEAHSQIARSQQASQREAA
ncbi:hypothetical protein LF1_46610 [Rubripirellula obstinata]|uniref:Uncharacterized protein n=1 Tax=Rubripirellula obstinata TaxID=406547 RepID=A0A5B1CR29_9BACT|nr:hypothetical protein [Rubripirellula obstinata]KAA1262100.1 hypothetical protein LF1_46610 [Rubripirellula obstinata]